MRALLVTMLMAATPAPVTQTLQVGGIQLQVPKTWAQKVEDGGVKVSSPTAQAFFRVDAARVQSAPMRPKACREKILSKMGGDDGWTMLKAGGFPAARRQDVDWASNHTVPIETFTYVGCNGVTTWSVVFHFDGRQRQLYAPLAEAIVHSVTYL